MKLKDSEFAAILSEVEAEIGSLLKSEQEKLAKAAPTDDSPAEDEGSAPAGDEGALGADAAPADEGSAPAGPEGSAPGDEASASAPPMDEGSAPAPDMQAQDPAADASAPADPAMLEAEYAKLPPEELKAHYMAAKAALFKLMGAGGDAAPAPDAGAPMAPPAPGAEGSAPPVPGAPGAPGLDPMMGKMELGSIAPSKASAGKDILDQYAPTKADGGEDRLAAVAPAKKGELSAGKKVNINNNGQGDHNLGKSEAGLSKSERDELNELKGTVNGLMKALENLAQPVRKAVTSVAFVPKAEVQEKRALSKAEVTAKLSEVTSNPSLKKSDRELVNAYFDGKIDLGQIEHLLK